LGGQKQREHNKRGNYIIKEKNKDSRGDQQNKRKEISLVLHPRDQRITHSERTQSEGFYNEKAAKPWLIE